MKKLFLLLVIFNCIGVKAQNPFAELGYTPKIATLSQGQYNEFFDNDTIIQIGSVLFNTNTKQIAAFVETDTLYSEATLKPDIVSRWMSPDPLTQKYPSYSPYNFVENNPIVFTDPDGQEKIPALDKSNPKDQTILAGAEKYKDDGAIHVFAHGWTGGIQVFVDGKKQNITTAKGLDKFLSKNSETWKNRKDEDKSVIVLHSCNTAKDDKNGGSSFAQKISESESFKNATIVAPTEIIWTSTEGETGTYKPVTDNNGEFKRTDKGSKIRSDEMGSWKVFQGGEQTGQYQGDWKPKENPTLMDNITKKEKVK